MNAIRGTERIIDSTVAPVGTFTVRRALPDRTRHAVGPWVFLDHFGPLQVKPGEDGVGPHPHAGIETVTYLFSGRQEHRDSAGNTGIVAAGGAQWMTSGRGIIHAERPQPQKPEEFTLHGLQLWTSLPRALKTMAPRYQRITADTIPEIALVGSRVRVVAGEFNGAKGPADLLMPTMLWHVKSEAGATFEAPVPGYFEVAAYVVAGEGRFGGEEGVVAKAGQLVVFETREAAIRFASTGSEPLEVMVFGGAPAEGPLVFHGPFVMNSVEQIRAAEIAYRTGRMGQLEEA